MAAFSMLAFSWLSACSPLTALNALLVPGESWRAYPNIDFGTEQRQRLDVYVPRAAAGPAPVVVFFYGGAWRGGRREHYRFVGEALTDRGYVVVIPDYRVYPEVRFPDFVRDGARAVAWVHAHVAEYGGDPQQLFLMGHSAGAHSAALLAIDRRYLAEARVERHSIRGLIGLAGPYAFDPSRYDSTRRIFETASDVAASQPITFVDGDEPPMLLLHGAEDETVYPVNSRVLAERVRATGGFATLVEYPDMGHIRIVLTLAKPFRREGGPLDAVARFLLANTSPPPQVASGRDASAADAPRVP